MSNTTATRTSNLRFAGDLFLINGRLKTYDHTARRHSHRHNRAQPTKYTPRNKHRLQQDIKSQKNNTEAVQGVNIEIATRRTNTSANSPLPQTQFDHRNKCSWATFACPRYATDRPTETLRPNGDTTSLLRFRNMDGDRGDEKETPDNTTTDAEDDHPQEDTAGATSQDPKDQEESSHDADSNPSSNCVPEYDQTAEDEVDTRVDHKARATHKAEDLLAASEVTPWILRHAQTWQNVLEVSQNDCQPPALDTANRTNSNRTSNTHERSPRRRAARLVPKKLRTDPSDDHDNNRHTSIQQDHQTAVPATLLNKHVAYHLSFSNTCTGNT